MNIPGEYGPAIFGGAFLIFGLALNWWSDRGIRKHNERVRKERNERAKWQTPL
ncbi:hypothetical protein [Paracoccus liaowanqingii]|uniref:hypothetical protein n=1 Tax=Paracoccus liaowanqingii TaxID=2560053 RepID=UPI00159B885E|nr:hypothetical protein [Paracoccus liaowanqingii]